MTFDTRVPEVELVKFLSEILVRKPVVDGPRTRSVGHRRARRWSDGTLVYRPFRLLEHDYDRLCQLVNEVRREFGWEFETFKKGEDA